MLRALLGVHAVLVGCVAPGASLDGLHGVDGVDDVAVLGTKEDGSSFTPCELDAVVGHANDPATSFDVLVGEGVHPTTAEHVVTHRDGPDAVIATDDDDLFDDIVEVDSVPHVGPNAMRALVDVVSEQCRVTTGTDHLAFGAPSDDTPGDDFMIERPQYVLSYNRFLNVANWAGWRLVASNFGDVPRREGFETDASLPSGFYPVTTNDYTGTGYDRGHIVRSEERTATDEDNAATFLMSNIMPQTPYLNRGPWAAHERFLQALVQRKRDTVYVIAGPIFDARCVTHGPRQIGDECADIGRSSEPARRVLLPVATFKIALVVKPGLTLADLTAADVIAVVMPNDGDIRSVPWTDYLTTVADIEARTGYRFSILPDVSDAERVGRFTTDSEHAEPLRSDETLVVGCGFSGGACEDSYDCCSDDCSGGVCL